MSSIKNVYILTSKMMVQRSNLKAISNNVANVNTNGYKKLEMDFSSMLSRKNGTEVATFAQQQPIRINFSAGSLSQTRNPLDMALNGEGMFAVEVNGERQFTRNGHFLMDSEGNLITEQGYPVLDRNFGAINIPTGTKDIKITKDGAIATETGVIAELGVFNFAKGASVENLGQGRYRTNQETTVIEYPKVFQGMLEDANVKAVEETVKLTELMRSYQSASKLIGRIEEVEGKAIRDLSRLPN